VADTDNHRVVKLSPTLDLLAVWGRVGRAPGEFQFPRGIVVAGDGTVLVSDRGNGRVQRFTPDGRLLGIWPPRDAEGEIPAHLTATGTGEVVGLAAGQLQRFTPSGQPRGHRAPAAPRSAPVGLAVGPAGRVHLLTGARGGGPQVQTYDRTGTLLASWGEPGSRPGQLFDPLALAVDPAGRVYVADGNARVLVFTPDGRFLHQWDRHTAPGLRVPRGLAIDRQGVVYVADGPRLLRLGPLPGP